MRKAIVMYPQLTLGNTMRSKLDSLGGEYYAVESELSKKTTYIERDGEFALVFGKQAIVLREDMWEELCDVLLDLRDRKKMKLTNKGVI